MIAVWTQSLQSAQPYDIELRQRGGSGVYPWFHVQGLPVRDAEGRIVCWCVLQTDIEDRKRAEEARRDSERELRQLIDSVPGMIVVADPTGQQEYANKRFLDYTGTTVEEVKGLDGLQLIHPAEREAVTTEWLRCKALGQPLELDHRLKRFDGVYRWMHVRVEPLLDDRGRIVRWYGLLTDIDDQRGAEEQLRRSERELRQLIDSVPAMIAVADSQGHSEYVNKRAIDYLDTTPEGFSDQPMDTVHPDDRELLRNEWQRSNSLGQPLDLVHRVRRFDGIYRWVHVRGEPLVDDRGRIVRWYYVFADIDDERRAEEALRQSERHMRLLVETIPALVSRSKADGMLDYVDRRVVDYTGRELEQIDLDIIHPDDQKSHVKKWHHAMKTGEAWEDTYRIRRADGEFRWFYDRIEPLRNPDGRVVSWYAVKIDIHDSREMEEMLRTTRRKLSAAMQVATVASLGVDRMKSISHWRQS